MEKNSLSQQIVSMPEGLPSEVKEWMDKIIYTHEQFDNHTSYTNLDELPFMLAKNGPYTLVGIKGGANLFTDNESYRKDIKGRDNVPVGVYFLAKGPLTELPVRNHAFYSQAYEKWADEHYATEHIGMTSTIFDTEIPCEPISAAAERTQGVDRKNLLFADNQGSTNLHLMDESGAKSKKIWAATALSDQRVTSVIDAGVHPGIRYRNSVSIAAGTVKEFTQHPKNIIRDDKLIWTLTDKNKIADLGSIPPIPAVLLKPPAAQPQGGVHAQQPDAGQSPQGSSPSPSSTTAQPAPSSPSSTSSSEKDNTTNRVITAVIAGVTGFLSFLCLKPADKNKDENSKQNTEQKPDNWKGFKIVGSVALLTATAIFTGHAITGGRWQAESGKKGIGKFTSALANYATNYTGWKR